MNIEKLIDATEKPEIYTPGTAQMWVDPYISKNLLETHLNPEIELASRKESTIATTLAWIETQLPAGSLDILDLGCGPGLYTHQLAQIGHRVTGVDFSARSIAYARAAAKESGLEIRYHEMDYLTLDHAAQYDLVMMIFTDFGVLTPDQRQLLLANVQRALKPGGIFLFDVLNDNYADTQSGAGSFEAVQKGFWRETPYLALSQSFFYEEEKVMLNQHVVIDEGGKAEIYRFWAHLFSPQDLTRILRAGGFMDVRCHENILPGCELYRRQDVTFCTARKR